MNDLKNLSARRQLCWRSPHAANNHGEDQMKLANGFILGCLALGLSLSSLAHGCYLTSIVAPTPFMGNSEEIFKTADGRLWQVKYEYEYLYEYYPTVYICNEEKLMIEGKALNIVPMSGSSPSARSDRSIRDYPVKIVFKRSGCRDYFLADGDSGGIYLLEWYGGHDPREGESIVGEIRGFGFKDVFYPDSGSSGRVYVEDYMLSRSSAIEKISDKCR